MDCIVCSKPVPRDGRSLKCSDCGFPYHLGQACSGISESTFKSMSAANKEKWRCRTCRTGDARSGASASGHCEHDDASGFGAQLAAVNQKLNHLVSLKASVDTLLQLPAKVDHLLALKPTVDKLSETISEVKESIGFFSAKYDSLLSSVTSNEQTIRGLQSEVSSLKVNVSDQASQIQRLQLEMNDAEQYTRLPNMEIHGLPCFPNENLEKSVHDIAQKLGLSAFQPSDILAVHRLSSRRDRTPDVIVKFASVKAKDKWMAARGRLRSLHESGDLPRLFLNDNLTRTNKALFWQTRTRGKEKRYRFIWVKNGKIFAKKDEGHPLIRVNCVADVDKIV